ncbi:transcriptional regulator [Natronococcus sp. A-GB7]|jgi:predicted transcriptional regulator|uniref:HVO_A0114 family putative DNA-binding protein n=1 Tax=Natronococcus sp. A-GB7 TaxID=3037649 RepID=UPI00241CB9FF|nr:transcriptional regulator [Natronococcus sp. A-GB7]MDG5818829.1 transcriptional regulator [Natronococcus sp. A-GB7]
MATTGTNPTDTERVLHIRFERSNTTRTEETLRAIDDGDDVDPYFECTFHDPEQLHQVTRPKNLELLRTIATEEPAGIRETARLVNRDVRQVHRNLNELESLGLIDFEERGTARRPTVWYDTIEVDLPLFGPNSGSDAADA